MNQKIIHGKLILNFVSEIESAIADGWTVQHIAVNSTTNVWLAVLSKVNKKESIAK